MTCFLRRICHVDAACLNPLLLSPHHCSNFDLQIFVAHSLNEAWPLFQRAVDPAMTGFDDLHAWFLSCMHNKSSQYIYIYAYPSAYIHTHIHTYIHPSSIHAYIHTVPTYTKHRTYMHGWMHAFMHTHTHTSYIHTCMHTCMHAFMHACMHGWMNAGWMHAVRTYVRTYVHAWVHIYNIDIISHGDSANTFTKRRSYLKNEIVISMVKQFQGSIWVGPKTRVPATDGLV